MPGGFFFCLGNNCGTKYECKVLSENSRLNTCVVCLIQIAMSMIKCDKVSAWNRKIASKLKKVRQSVCMEQKNRFQAEKSAAKRLDLI